MPDIDHAETELQILILRAHVGPGCLIDEEHHADGSRKVVVGEVEIVVVRHLNQHVDVVGVRGHLQRHVNGVQGAGLVPVDAFRDLDLLQGYGHALNVIPVGTVPVHRDGGRGSVERYLLCLVVVVSLLVVVVSLRRRLCSLACGLRCRLLNRGSGLRRGRSLLTVAATGRGHKGDKPQHRQQN